MAGDANLSEHDAWFTNVYRTRPPDNDIERIAELGINLDLHHKVLEEELNATKPTIIIACGATPLRFLCPQTASRSDGASRIGLWKGSLLTSPRLNHPHYIVPMPHPAFILREWSERPIGVFCIARAVEERDFWLHNGTLQPLPERSLIVEPSADCVIDYLTNITDKKLQVSHDIECIKCSKKVSRSGFFPYTTSLAISPSDAISFSFWDYVKEKLAKIWRLLDLILGGNRQIGQNYLGFDCNWLEYLGFRVNENLVDDTMVMHHILFPEFEHKLQFQTFQFTRQPYYKMEGRGWKPSEKAKLMRYNALDSTVTFECYLAMMEEFKSREVGK
jgi:hypothetical protein